MSAATKTKARAEVVKVPGVWQIAAAGVRFTATVEHIRNPGRAWTRRITIMSSVPLRFIPGPVHHCLQAQIEAALGADWPCWLRVWWHDHWRTYRHQTYIREYPAAEISASVVEALEYTRREASKGHRRPA